MQGGAAKIGARQLGAREVGAAKDCALCIHLGEVGPFQAHVRQLGAEQPRLDQRGAIKLRAAQHRKVERNLGKISTDQIEKSESITAPVKDGGKKGLPYETIESWTGIDQLDRLDPQHALVVRRNESGSLDLESLDLP